MSRILESVLPEAIRNEGLMFVPQILEDLMRGKLDREFPARLDEGEDPASARTYAFDVARRLYRNFADSLSQANDKAVTRKFVVNLLDNALGWRFDRDAALADTDSPFLAPPLDPESLNPDNPVNPVKKHDSLDGASLDRINRIDGIDVRWAFPVVVCPHKADLDQSLATFHGWGLSDSGRSATRFAQEFVNARDECLWALATNGKELRLVRDNPSLTRPSFLSFDLPAILGGAGDFPAFAFLWRMLHGSRVDVSFKTGLTGFTRLRDNPDNPVNPVKKEDLSGENSLWERLHARSSETGVRALAGLRSGVVTAIEVLGTGFLKRNPALREALQDGSLSAQAYEQELLHLAYRFLFLFIAEERKLLHTPGTSDAVKRIYREGYSMARLRRIAARYAAGSSDRHTDLYEGVRLVFAGLAHGEARLGLTALGGIFEERQCAHLDGARLANADLVAAMRALRYIDAGKKLFPVNYRDMGSEEFGSVYEGLLELVPNYTAATQTFSLVGAAGNSRKTTGSYYTPSSLVEKQVESALVPLIDRCARAPEPERALLALRVIDTSCGSGHFVVAAARRLATALVEARGGDSSPEAYQRALRDVVCNAVYGVDINPLAVELAKITLWIESVVPGQPLSFLDAHFVCGDATLGIDNLRNLENGIPAAAYKPLPGDDKEAAQRLAKKNRAELKAVEKDRKALQPYLPTIADALSAAIAKVAAMPESTLAEVEAKKAAYAQYLSGAASNRLVQAANLFTAAFLLPKVSSDRIDRINGIEGVNPDNPVNPVKKTIPTTSNLLSRLTGSIAYEPPTPEMQAAADAVCRENRVLHWPLAFPAVFENGGFDCILTNPPWDQLQVSEEEFFAPRDPSISALAGAKRKVAIAKLQEINPALWHQFQDAVSRQTRANEFIGESGRFPLSAVGKLNLYSILAETITHVVNANGYAGVVLPTGICTDDSNKKLFETIVTSKKLVSFLSFENEERLFADVHHSFKFALVTLGQCEQADFTFFNRSVASLSDERRHFTLASEDLLLFNPNTRTAPIFRSKADAELAKKIYRRVGVLFDESRVDGNPWGISFRQGLFNMTSASNLFLTEDQLPHTETRSHGEEGGEFLDRIDRINGIEGGPVNPVNPVNPVQQNLCASAPPCENYLPLYEAKMIHQFDHRWTTYEPGESDVRDVTLAEKQDPDYEPRPRYWVERKHVEEKFLDRIYRINKINDDDSMNPPPASDAATSSTSPYQTHNSENPDNPVNPVQKDLRVSVPPCENPLPRYLLGWRDVTSAVALRTDVASVIPAVAVGHKFQLFFTTAGDKLNACLLADMDSLVHDWCARQKVGGISFSYSYKRQVPTLSPAAYTQADIDFIVPRVLELTYTSHSLKGWAEALGYTGDPFKFDPERRAVLRAELDARYARLYGLDERELTYVLDPAAVYGPDYPSESFRVLKEKELAEFGEYRTMRLVLEAFRREG